MNNFTSQLLFNYSLILTKKKNKDPSGPFFFKTVQIPDDLERKQTARNFDTLNIKKKK